MSDLPDLARGLSNTFSRMKAHSDAVDALLLQGKNPEALKFFRENCHPNFKMAREYLTERRRALGIIV